MNWTCRLAIACLCCAAETAHAAYKVEIDAPKPVQSLLKDFLDLSRYQNRDDISDDQLKFMIDTVGDQVRDLASTEGYFSPQTKVEVNSERSADGQKEVKRVIVHVEPGQRTEIGQADIQATGAVAQQDSPRVEAIRRDWLLPPGKPFRQEDWDKAKDAGLQALQQKKYAAARIADSRAEIDPDNHRADLSVQYDSGPAFTLGPLQITGAKRYPESIIHNVNPLNVGEPYDADRLLSLQRQIQNTPYFSNAIVGIDDDPEHPDMAPVKVQVTEFPTQRVRTGVGYGTDTGAQVEGRYSHYNVFNRAYAFDSQLRLEQKRQYGLLSLAMPPDEKAFVNSVNSSYERTTLEGIDLRSLQTGIKRARTGELYDTTYSLTYYRDQLTQENGATPPANTVVTPGKHQALVPGFAWARRDVDNPIFPRHGNLLTLEAGFAIKGALTDQTFTRLYGRFKQFVPVGRRDLVVLRAELGGVFTAGRASEVPASLLFRTGGNDSVRGYSYQSIGNEQNGTVYPTKYLAVGSTEYQHWLTENWGTAVFYDIGAAADNWNNKTFYNGVGAGARWRSPVGTLNLDLAYGVQKRQIRPHVSLGIAF
ncbi:MULTISPECIES: autotransporter assembly complex family protein [unclassified Herbaspirillum]|uniref:autotransporter assembly complex protein TamA n=1 Tax=unclassified Herbaspirillum TaxID=2624150 RepID=UPI00114E44DA|nr:MULTISPECIES: autotransporter assembly complex family protein [unclassified Herbaspirillum]MBB5391075.1 translocation and assembly module TamA [Herbaspirillum sp. SJZ102]TQK13234.1 autotransporter secretion outer membrane protein TamA [Herbaspirillum sp. SJZ130]TQK15238.1 autotransporter secretion outer membrane protein TamA [Herbaspirillum sp. SJZ106]